MNAELLYLVAFSLAWGAVGYDKEDFQCPSSSARWCYYKGQPVLQSPEDIDSHIYKNGADYVVKNTKAMCTQDEVNVILANMHVDYEELTKVHHYYDWKNPHSYGKGRFVVYDLYGRPLRNRAAKLNTSGDYSVLDSFGEPVNWKRMKTILDKFRRKITYTGRRAIYVNYLDKEVREGEHQLYIQALNYVLPNGICRFMVNYKEVSRDRVIALLDAIEKKEKEDSEFNQEKYFKKIIEVLYRGDLYEPGIPDEFFIRLVERAKKELDDNLAKEKASNRAGKDEDEPLADEILENQEPNAGVILEHQHNGEVPKSPREQEIVENQNEEEKGEEEGKQGKQSEEEGKQGKQGEEEENQSKEEEENQSKEEEEDQSKEEEENQSKEEENQSKEEENHSKGEEENQSKEKEVDNQSEKELSAPEHEAIEPENVEAKNPGLKEDYSSTSSDDSSSAPSDDSSFSSSSSSSFGTDGESLMFTFTETSSESEAEQAVVAIPAAQPVHSKGEEGSASVLASFSAGILALGLLVLAI